MEIDQDDLDVFFVIHFDNGTSVRRKVTLPEPKRGKDGKGGKDGAFWVRGGIANTASAGVQQVYVLATIGSTAPTYAGTPLLVFRPTGVADTYTMEIINS